MRRVGGLPDEPVTAYRLAELADDRLERTLELLARLVAEPSVDGSPAIGRCLDLVEAEVTPLARSIERPRFEGVESLVARFGEGPPERRLLLSGHVDVVPVEEGWETPPFELTRHGTALVGRGTCDMKGAVAAFVGALQLVDELGLLACCALELALTGDEEVGSERGTIALLEHGLLSGRFAVCGEPTGLDIFLGNRGVVWLEIAVHGRGGHAGLSHLLANPVPVAARLAAKLHVLPLAARDERFDPPEPSLNVTRIDAGASLGAVNVVPKLAVLGVDRRLLPDEDPDEAIAAIRAAVEEVITPPFRGELTVLRRWPPYLIEPDEPLVVAAQEAVRATGRPGALGTDLAANDSSWLGAAGIPTVLLGPGCPAAAHASEESVTVREVRDAVEIYARLALALTRGT
jgi:acetylornithine deacetylase/succinyl-diaminopimelate desuccinylase-like protein